MGFLSGVGDFLFGESPSVETSAATSKQTPEQQALMKKLLSYYTDFAGESVEGYTGDRVAQLESAGVEGELAGTLGTLNRFESGEFTTPKYLEDYYQKSIEEPLMKRWKEEIMPTIGGEFETRGLFMGSGRREAEIDSAEALMDTMGKGRADLYSQMEESGRAQQLQATTLKGNTLSDILGISAAQRGIEQQGFDVGYTDWLRTQPGTRPQDQILMQLLGLETMNEPTTVVDPGHSGLLQELAGPAATLGSAAIMASAKRFKEHINDLVDPSDVIQKLKGVSFDWKKDGRHDYGFIADDVEEILPDVVAKDMEGNVAGMSYVAIIPFLVETVKILLTEVDVLKGGA